MPKDPKWDDSFYLRVYLMACKGLKRPAIAAALGLSTYELKAYYNRKPALKEAMDKGYEGGNNPKQPGKEAVWSDFVYRRLPPDLKVIWEQIRAAEKAGNDFEKVEAIMANTGQKARQHLWFHAFCTSLFNKTEACRRLGIGRFVLQQWMEDPEFVRMVAAVQEMQKDFIEFGLMKLIQAGDVSATIFAARTKLRDRGYDTKVTIEHTGSVLHKHVDINELLREVPQEVKRELLAAMERMEQKALRQGEVIEAEVVQGGV